MKAKEITILLERAIADLQSAHEPARNKAQKEIHALRHAAFANAQAIWKTRTHTETVRLSGRTEVLREMLVPYNAVRHGLKKLGINPDEHGITQDYVLDDQINAALETVELYVKTQDYQSANSHVSRLLDTLQTIGLTDESATFRRALQLKAFITEGKFKWLREYLTLVNESLNLRVKAADNTITRKEEDRLAGISSYLYRNRDEFDSKTVMLSSDEYLVMSGGLNRHEIETLRKRAHQRYVHAHIRVAEEQAVLKKAAEQRSKDARDDWNLAEWEAVKRLAKEECVRRYGHDSIAISNDHQPDGHIYSGPDQMEWITWPENGDPGVFAAKAGELCLCCHTKFADGALHPTGLGALVDIPALVKSGLWNNIMEGHKPFPDVAAGKLEDGAIVESESRLSELQHMTVQG